MFSAERGRTAASLEGMLVEAQWNPKTESFVARIGKKNLRVKFLDKVVGDEMAMTMEAAVEESRSRVAINYRFGYRVVEDVYFWKSASAGQEFLVVNTVFGAHAGGLYIFNLKETSTPLVKYVESTQPITLEWDPAHVKLGIRYTTLQGQDGEEGLEAEVKSEFVP